MTPRVSRIVVCKNRLRLGGKVKKRGREEGRKAKRRCFELNLLLVDSGDIVSFGEGREGERERETKKICFSRALNFLNKIYDFLII